MAAMVPIGMYASPVFVMQWAVGKASVVKKIPLTFSFAHPPALSQFVELYYCSMVPSSA